METTTTPAAPELRDPRNADAYANGQAHAELISAAYAVAQFASGELEGRALDRAARQLLRELGYPDRCDGDDLRDAAEEYAREQALSCEVQSDWQTAGEPLTPARWRVLLTTGGPELVLTGHFDRWGEPTAPELQCRTWGTQFEPVRSADDEALRWFACLFYWCVV